MKSITILLASVFLCACSGEPNDPGQAPVQDQPHSSARVIKYQFDGDAETEVLLTHFDGASSKTVAVNGEEATSDVDPEEFNYLWDAKDDLPIIKESLLGDEFSGIDTKTHHIISYVDTGATGLAVMHAVPVAGETPEFKAWLAKLLK